MGAGAGFWCLTSQWIVRNVSAPGDSRVPAWPASLWRRLVSQRVRCWSRELVQKRTWYEASCAIGVDEGVGAPSAAFIIGVALLAAQTAPKQKKSSRNAVPQAQTSTRQKKTADTLSHAPPDNIPSTPVTARPADSAASPHACSISVPEDPEQRVQRGRTAGIQCQLWIY